MKPLKPNFESNMDIFEKHIRDTQIAIRIQIRNKIKELEKERESEEQDEQLEITLAIGFWKQELKKIHILGEVEWMDLRD